MNNHDAKNSNPSPINPAGSGGGITTRQLILDAASNLIMRYGVEGTSLADIARETGISKGTLFYHFPSKNELVYEVTDQHFSRITNKLIDTARELRAAKSRTDIFALALNTIITDERRGRLNLYLLADAVTDNEELRLRFRDKFREYRELMKEFIGLTMPDETDNERIEALASLYVAVVNGLVTQWLIEQEETPVKQISDILAAWK